MKRNLMCAQILAVRQKEEREKEIERRRHALAARLQCRGDPGASVVKSTSRRSPPPPRSTASDSPVLRAAGGMVVAGIGVGSPLDGVVWLGPEESSSPSRETTRESSTVVLSEKNPAGERTQWGASAEGERDTHTGSSSVGQEVSCHHNPTKSYLAQSSAAILPLSPQGSRSEVDRGEHVDLSEIWDMVNQMELAVKRVGAAVPVGVVDEEEKGVHHHGS